MLCSMPPNSITYLYSTEGYCTIFGAFYPMKTIFSSQTDILTEERTPPEPALRHVDPPIFLDVYGLNQ